MLDWHRNESPKFSGDGRPNAVLTCRHFGLHKSYFHRWNKRFDRRSLSTLEDMPTAPKKKREPSYTRELVGRVREIRKADPTYSAKKIRPILLRTMSCVPSVATIGRLISRENLFFRADTERRGKLSKSARKSHERRRKPYRLLEGEAERVVEGSTSVCSGESCTPSARCRPRGGRP